jgi:hypothetical protein
MKKFKPDMDLIAFLDERKRNIDDILDRFGRHYKTRELLKRHIDHGFVTPKLKVDHQALERAKETAQSRRDKAILKLMKDGKWRSRQEIADALKNDVRVIERDTPRLSQDGLLLKVGTEFRSAAARWNRPSERNRDVYALLATPILERNVPKRLEGLEDPAHTYRLKQLEEQELIQCRILTGLSKQGEALSREFRFWFQSKAANKMDYLAEKLGVDENGTFSVEKLPKRHASPRTALSASRPPPEDETYTPTSPAP